MKAPGFTVPFGRGLSGKILALTVVFVLIGEVLIFLPSVARFRVVWLQQRLDASHLTTLAVEGDRSLDPELERTMLAAAGVGAIWVNEPSPKLMLGRDRAADVIADIEAPWPRLIADALATLTTGGERWVFAAGMPEGFRAREVAVLFREDRLRRDMLAYAGRILALSLFLSALVAISVFVALRVVIVRPLARITRQMAAFEARPEDASLDQEVSKRSDEIGIVSREFAKMRAGVRQALSQRARLAALGEAVGKINHDLRAVLATALLISDRLEGSGDPDTRKAAPRLIEALERASRLCGAILSFAKGGIEPPRMALLSLRGVIEEAWRDLDHGARGVDVRLDVPPDLAINGDPDQLYRVFLNMGRNALEALPGGGSLRATVDVKGHEVVVGVVDDGGGIPVALRDDPFRPFASGSGGSGLGLAICREIMRNHGGDARLAATGPSGTRFELVFPRVEAVRAAA